MLLGKTPLITIGITCFNAEDTIARALKSARKQNWGNLEIVVVDDKSSDNSSKIIENTMNKDRRVRFYRHKENRGYPSALNTIVEHAKGEYIAFFDDDDDSEPNRLVKQYDRLHQFKKKYPDAPVICYTHRRVIVNEEENTEHFLNAIGAKTPEPQGSMVANFILWHEKANGYEWGAFGSCTMMTSKNVLQDLGFDPNFRRCSEWDFAIRIALQGGYFIAVDEPLVIQYKTQTSDKQGRKPLDYALMLRKKHQRYLLQNNVYFGSILQAYSRFYYFRDKPWRSRLCLALACLLSPTKIMADEIAKRAGRKGTRI